MLRSDPDKVRAWQRRSRSNLRRTAGLRQRSPRKAARRVAVGEACAAAMTRDGFRCQAGPLVPDVRCGGPLDPHHLWPRLVSPSHVADPSAIVCVCRAHHDWIGDHPVAARLVGLHGHAGDDPAALAHLRSQNGLGAPLAASGGPTLTDHYPPTPDGAQGETG